MANYTLQRESPINQPISAVFDFFSKAETLEKITPPWLRFRMLMPPPMEMPRAVAAVAGRFGPRREPRSK